MTPEFRIVVTCQTALTFQADESSAAVTPENEHKSTQQLAALKLFSRLFARILLNLLVSARLQSCPPGGVAP